MAYSGCQWQDAPRDRQCRPSQANTERLLVLGLLFDQLLAWVRSLPGSSDLRALVLFDEVYGFLPPHPANPPTKRPMLALLKQARAFGVGLLLATQNPMDLDYKALSNAGLWLIGRLQTDADRDRVVDGLAGVGTDALSPQQLGDLLKHLPARNFFLRNVHAKPRVRCVGVPCCLSWLRGPMTRQELKRVYAPLKPTVTRTAEPTSSASTAMGRAGRSGWECTESASWYHGDPGDSLVRPAAPSTPATTPAVPPTHVRGHSRLRLLVHPPCPMAGERTMGPVPRRRPGLGATFRGWPPGRWHT